jgi:transposase, IS5 family
VAGWAWPRNDGRVDSEQPSFTDIEYGNRRRVSRREQFLDTMDATVPWGVWVGLIEPHYYADRPGKRGRKAKPVETMLRMYLLQAWFSLSDEGVEDAIYDSYAMRKFMRLDFAVEQVPDATTLLHFRHLLEEHQLGEQLFAAQNEIFEREGWIMRGGSIIDATIIAAPSSTKNATGTRDPEMHQTRKGNQWYFGMKAHIGADSQTKLIHSVVATPANVHDSQVLIDLLHGEETRVWGDAAYTGQRDIIRERAPKARDFTQQKATRHRPLTEYQRTTNRTKSSVRAKLEHIIGVIKRVFGFAKVRYRGLAKNAHRLFVTCALANLFMVRRHLLRVA